jgi:alpha-glucosidase
VEVRADGGFSVTHEASPERTLLASPTGASAIAAFRVADTIAESNGSFTLDEDVATRCDSLGGVTISASESEVSVRGELACGDDRAQAILRFKEESVASLAFSLALEGEALPFNQVALVQAATADERYVGFGEQFSFVDLRGHAFPILVQEQGIGRAGTLATTLGVSGGTQYSTYAPMPYFLSSEGRALLLDNDEVSYFDLTAEDRIVTRLRGTEMRGHVLFGAKPKDVIEVLTTFTGRMPKLPAWINEGAVIGMQGGTARVREVLSQLDAKQTKLGGFWLQDWVGKRATAFGSRLWWNWQLNASQYPEWDKLVSDLDARGIRMLTYVNPYLVDVDGDANFSRNLYAEARDAGYLVKDAMGMPYVHTSGTFSAGIVDLTNSDAASWLKDVIRKEVLGVGAVGYMADFGEALAFDSVLAQGSPELVHNRFPELWARLNQELFEEEGLTGEGVFFSRAGYTRSPGLSPLFWLGDQLTSWDADDGLESSITGMLSGGLSGISLNHSDIGGYTAVLTVVRSKELLLRWMELSAFTSVYRTHEGNQPAQNAQFYDDDESLTAFARFADVFAALAPYRDKLMDESSTKGIPVVRHMLLEYPDDARAWSEGRVFMLGPDVIVSPVVKEGATKVKTYLPGGEWIHLWSGTSYAAAGEVEVEAPLGQPAVFYRVGSQAGQALEQVK